MVCFFEFGVIIFEKRREKREKREERREKRKERREETSEKTRENREERREERRPAPPKIYIKTPDQPHLCGPILLRIHY